VIDDGEELLAGLVREVEEETGLVVTEWEGPLYEIQADAPGLGWRLRVEAWRALSFEGDLRIDDPDGIVIDARFVGVSDCGGHLAGGHPWVGEPLSEWLLERWDGTRRYGYRVDGTELRSLVVTRM
jgi:8-oxo-dGTP pyrophosphatase MutT (NUDIX family)